MRFKLFKSVSNVFISSLVVLFQLGENFRMRYTKIPHKALLPYMRLYKWFGWSNERDWKCVWDLRHHTFDLKKFSNIRTHPEELRPVKSKKCCYIYIIASKIYFSRRVVLWDEFLCYWIFYDQKVWCLSSQTHFQLRSFDYRNHFYNLIYGNKALCGILVYLKFSPSWNKTTRDDMRTFETDLKSLNLILYAFE